MLSAAHAQFAPQAHLSGSTAIKGDSSIFVAWATNCTVQRGYRDIAVPDSGFATAGSDANGAGPYDQNVVSLGDSGIATLTFASPIINGPGSDFAVFENGFANPGDPEEAFLELAFVEVSSNGTNYYRFPAASFTPESPQISVAGQYTNARNLNNLAGKYIGGYGTPFDLEELSMIGGLDVNHITHVRLIDVVGSVGAHASLDTGGRKINDPYPTNIPTSGFDFDALGVIHQAPTFVSNLGSTATVTVYPNPVTDKLILSTTDAQAITYTLSDLAGKLLLQGNTAGYTSQISMAAYNKGLYYLTLQDTNGNKWVEKITKL